MKNIGLLAAIVFLLMGCASAENTTKPFSNIEKETLRLLLEEVIETKTKQSLPNIFYSDIYEVNPDYAQSILDKEYPSTPDSVYNKAISDVKRDILSGLLLIKKTGLGVIYKKEDGTEWDVDKIYSDLLNERYRVKIDALAGDLINSQITLYKETYNSISLEVINRFYKTSDIRKIVRESIPEEINIHGSKRKEWIYK